MFTSTNLGAQFVRKPLSHSIIILFILISRPKFMFLPHYGVRWRSRNLSRVTFDLRWLTVYRARIYLALKSQEYISRISKVVWKRVLVWIFAGFHTEFCRSIFHAFKQYNVEFVVISYLFLSDRIQVSEY